MVALHALLEANYPEVLEDAQVMKQLEAGKGGFNGEDSFVTIDGNKVGRICAMTGGVFAHDNTDKEASYFYKNGSYVIPAEVMKASARKAFDADKAVSLQALEDQMLEGDITPAEWKEAKVALDSEVFEYHMDDATKAEIIETYEGYPSKEAFTEAYNAGEVRPFSDFADEIEALRNPVTEAEDAE